jgi:hypothetical protein
MKVIGPLPAMKVIGPLPAMKVIGPLPAATSYLSLVWAVLDQASRG